MGRFIRDIVLFVPIASIMYIVLLFCTALIYKDGAIGNIRFVRGGHGHLWTRVRDHSIAFPQDVLVVGSSLAYRGFDPRIFAMRGYRLFDLGSSAQTPAQSEVLLKHHWHRSKASLVLFIVTEDMFANAGIESSLDLISNDRIDWATGIMSLQAMNITVTNTLIYAGLRQALELDARYQEPPNNEYGDRYISGGYVERIVSGHQKEEHKPAMGDTPLNRQLRAFQRAISFVVENGAQAVIIHPPVTASYRPDRTSAWGPTYWASLAPYYDLSGLHHEPDSMFFLDGRHQSQTGVIQFNEELIKLMEADKYLPTLAPGTRPNEIKVSGVSH